MYCLSYVVNYRYISAAAIMIIFIWSIYWRLKRCCKEYGRFGREERMENDIAIMKAELEEIKDQQKEMLEEIKDQQKEMLNLLKELKSAKYILYIDTPCSL